MLCHCGSVSVQSCTDMSLGLSVCRAVQMLCHCGSVSVQSCTDANVDDVDTVLVKGCHRTQTVCDPDVHGSL